MDPRWLALVVAVLWLLGGIVGFVCDLVRPGLRDGGSAAARWSLYLLSIALAAFLSQLAEWAHLTYAADWSWLAAVATALSLAVPEYLVSVASNRLGLIATHDDALLMNYIWNALQVRVAVRVPLAHTHTPDRYGHSIGLVLLAQRRVLRLAPRSGLRTADRGRSADGATRGLEPVDTLTHGSRVAIDVSLSHQCITVLHPTHTDLMLFACVVWLGWVLLQTHGATIIARSPVTDVLDGTIQRTQMLTVRCTGADYGTVTSFNLTDANGVARQMNVTCGEVAYRYQMTVVGYVPRDGTMYVREYCELQQLAANNTVQDLLATRAVTTGTGARRRLLFAWAPVAANALLSVGGGMAGAEIICNLGQACGGGGGSINMDDVVKRVRNDMSAELNRLQALNAFQSATQAWENNVDNSLNHTYSSILGLQNVTEILGASLGRTQTDLAGAQGEIKRLTLLTSANFNSSQQNILDVRTYVDNLTSSIGIDTRAEFNRSYLNANRIETDTKTAINTLSNRLESIVTTLLSNQRASFKTARDLATAVRKLAVRYQATRALTRLLLDVIDLAHNAGLTPFVGNLGTHSQDTSGVLAPAIEVVQFTYFTNITGVGVRAFWVRMTYSCNALYLLNNLGGWYSWRDFLETIGPTGCDPNSDVNGVGCSCTMSVEQLQCDSSSAGVASVNFTSGQSLNSIV